MKCNGLPVRHAEEKKSMIDRILAGPPYSAEEKSSILDYCQQDVDDAAALFRVLWDRASAGNTFYLAQALLRGEYAKSMADMTRTGCPVNVELHDLIITRWPQLRAALIHSVSHYGLFDEQETFKHDRFAVVIESLGAGDIWPRTPTGQFSVKSKDFRRMTEIYPQMEEFRAVHEAIASASKISPFPICSDGRLRLGRREQGNHRLGLDGERTDLWGLERIGRKRAEISPVPRSSCLVPRHGGGRWLPRNPARRLAISIISRRNSASQPTYTVIDR